MEAMVRLGFLAQGHAPGREESFYLVYPFGGGALPRFGPYLASLVLLCDTSASVGGSAKT